MPPCDTRILLLRIPGTAGIHRSEDSADAAVYEPKLREFILPTTPLRTAEAPDKALLEFAQSTYDAASTLGKWDRAALEEKKPALHSSR